MCNVQNLSTLRKIASQARANFETRTVDEAELKQLYQQYNSLDDIDVFLESAKEIFPNLNCGLATVYLKKLFSEGRIVNGKYLNNNHTFLLFKESIVVDITSDQYGSQKVYVGKLQYPWSLE